MEEPLDDTTPKPPPPPVALPLGKTLLINMGIMLLYMLLSGFGKGEAAMGNLIIDAFGLVTQVSANILIGLIFLFIPEKRQVGAAMLISGFVIGILGFGACIGKAAIMDSL